MLKIQSVLHVSLLKNRIVESFEKRSIIFSKLTTLNSIHYVICNSGIVDLRVFLLQITHNTRVDYDQLRSED